MITENSVLNVSDPLLLADWLQYSKEKLLILLQGNISTILHNILQHDQPNIVDDDSNEEAFLQVQLDVIQVLDQLEFPFMNTNILVQNLSNINTRQTCLSIVSKCFHSGKQNNQPHH